MRMPQIMAVSLCGACHRRPPDQYLATAAPSGRHESDCQELIASGSESPLHVPSTFRYSGYQIKLEIALVDSSSQHPHVAPHRPGFDGVPTLDSMKAAGSSGYRKMGYDLSVSRVGEGTAPIHPHIRAAERGTASWLVLVKAESGRRLDWGCHAESMSVIVTASRLQRMVPGLISHRQANKAVGL